MIKGIVLRNKISCKELEVDLTKIDVVGKQPMT